jgi:hypothetical protein
MQERRNTLAHMKLIEQNAQQGQQQFYASMKCNLALAKHAARSGSGRRCWRRRESAQSPAQ